MDETIIIGLAIILLLCIILYNLHSLKEQEYDQDYKNPQGNCSQTAFGCCPDGYNSKMNYDGSNCPAYNPDPGYEYTSQQQPVSQPHIVIYNPEPPYVTNQTYPLVNKSLHLQPPTEDYLPYGPPINYYTLPPS
jgi:hypothetical protein